MKTTLAALLTSATIGLSGGSVHAQQAAPVPIQEFLKDKSGNDPSAIRFVLMRCAALFLTASGIIEAKDPQGAKELKNSAMKFAQGAAPNGDGGTKYVIDQVSRMGDMYLDRIKSSLANSGKPLEDPLVSSDMTFCKLIAK